ncbi:MAG: hypothetical protein HC877_11770 [Thioploca sp.]|nr:hypothetical protein [Thioploca sp.]
MDQKQVINYALLQGTTGGDVGKTFLNSPVDIRLRIKNEDKLVIHNSGHVGIGTANPIEKLEVNGNRVVSR